MQIRARGQAAVVEHEVDLEPDRRDVEARHALRSDSAEVSSARSSVPQSARHLRPRRRRDLHAEHLSPSTFVPV